MQACERDSTLRPSLTEARRTRRRRRRRWPPARGPARARRRRLRLRRARHGQDDVRARRLRGARRPRAGDEPDVHDRPPLPRRRGAVSHLDLYRFDGVSAAESGDSSRTSTDAIAFVEWPEAGGAGCRAPRYRGAVAARGDARERWFRATSADAGVRHCDGGRDERARRRRTRCSASGASRAQTLLADADALLRQAGAHPGDLARSRSAPARSFTGIRIGLAVARGLALALDVRAQASRRSTRSRPAPGALPVIDARRREVFTLGDGEPMVARACGAELAAGTVSSATARSATASCSRRAAPTSRRTTTSGTFRARASTPRLPATRRGRRDRAALPARARRRGERPMTSVELRRSASRPRRDRGDRAALVPDAVVALDVRRRVAKPSRSASALSSRTDERRARCAATHRVPLRRRLARDEPRRRSVHRGRDRLAAARALFELTADDARRGYTLEVRVSNATAIGLYERLGFEARACAAATTPTTARTR